MMVGPADPAIDIITAYYSCTLHLCTINILNKRVSIPSIAIQPSTRRYSSTSVAQTSAWRSAKVKKPRVVVHAVRQPCHLSCGAAEDFLLAPKAATFILQCRGSRALQHMHSQRITD